MKAPLEVSGPAAPPRRNGEVVFDEPWQSRAFGIAVALAEGDRISWDRFRARLIAEIERAPQAPYWACWLAALEKTCAAAGLCGVEELAAAVHALAAREPGHDH